MNDREPVTPDNFEETVPTRAGVGALPLRHPAMPWLAAGTAIIALLLVLLPSAIGIVGTWNSSQSYTHGYLVLPISAWLLWRGRASYASADLKPWWPALILLALAGALWFVGYLTNIKSFRDLALVASIPLTLIMVLGKVFARRAMFSLAFMLFAWPFGEVFIPSLVDLTADFTVLALRLSGVPVFREGNSFVIPSGEWSVVQECSGVNYLLVSLFAGSLFGYLNFRSNRRRWVFLALALLVPIFANWLRAYGIVLLGHITSNKLAAGVDHLVYGWLFFGIVMTGLFYFAVRFMGEPEPGSKPPPARVEIGSSPPMRAVWLAAVTAVALSAVAPLAAARLDALNRSAINQGVALLPATLGQWTLTSDQQFGWPSPFEGATSIQREIYRLAENPVEVHLAWYASDSGASKLVRFEGATRAEFDSTWRLQSRTDLRVSELSPELHVIERDIRSSRLRILVWQWALVGDIEASGFVGSKLALARARLSAKGSHSTGVALATPIREEDVAGARERLQRFAFEFRPWLGTGQILKDQP